MSTQHWWFKFFWVPPDPPFSSIPAHTARENWIFGTCPLQDGPDHPCPVCSPFCSFFFSCHLISSFFPLLYSPKSFTRDKTLPFWLEFSFLWSRIWCFVLVSSLILRCSVIAYEFFDTMCELDSCLCWFSGSLVPFLAYSFVDNWSLPGLFFLVEVCFPLEIIQLSWVFFGFAQAFWSLRLLPIYTWCSSVHVL